MSLPIQGASFHTDEEFLIDYYVTQLKLRRPVDFAGLSEEGRDAAIKKSKELITYVGKAI